MQKNIMRVKKRLILKRNFLCFLFGLFMSFTVLVSFIKSKNNSIKKNYTQAQNKKVILPLQTKK